MGLRQGEIYWIADCPPLHGRVAAPHAVVVVSPPALLRDDAAPIYGIVISSSIPSPGPEHVAMPNSRTQRRCTTGMTRPCWAVTHWILRITDRSKLGSRSGYVGGKTLERIILGFVDAVEQGKVPIEHPAAVDG